jgi:hypothetical protein
MTQLFQIVARSGTLTEVTDAFEDGAVAEPFRWLSPRELIEGDDGADGDGVREPRSPIPGTSPAAVQLDEPTD